MTIRGDSYGSADEVLAFTKHLLGGEETFNAATRPTNIEVEKFIDRASGILNVALSGVGLTTPVTNSTAKLSCDEWVISQAVGYVELTQRGAGFNASENSRHGSFLNLHASAQEFADIYRQGFERIGVGVSHRVSEGLAFTALDDQDERLDPDDGTLEQPKFKRGLFDAYSSDVDTSDT